MRSATLFARHSPDDMLPKKNMAHYPFNARNYQEHTLHFAWLVWFSRSKAFHLTFDTAFQTCFSIVY